VKRIIMPLTVMAAVLATALPAYAGEESSGTTTTTPTTEVPVTEVPVTEVPVTTTTPSTTDVPETVTTDVPDPVVTDVDTGCVVDCIPEDEPVVEDCVTTDCIPVGSGAVAPVAVGSGAVLPFTGIEDVIAPLLLGLVVFLGGFVAWRWAGLREAVAAASTRRGRTNAYTPPTGYGGAAKQLGFEQRAAEVFSARVA